MCAYWRNNASMPCNILSLTGGLVDAERTRPSEPRNTINHETDMIKHSQIVMWTFLRNRRLLLCLHTIFRKLKYWAHRAVILSIAWHLVFIASIIRLLFNCYEASQLTRHHRMTTYCISSNCCDWGLQKVSDNCIICILQLPLVCCPAVGDQAFLV